MSPAEMRISLAGNPAGHLAAAREALTRAGGSLHGDQAGGTFSLPTPLGSIEGRYTLTGGEMHVVILRKPLLVSHGRIEEELRRFLTSGRT